ncbi:MAG TPA: hypothetical protein VD837_13860 [Terriglobales bacterium]|nr:hypothetical protein [Terriglobales bacterium]
MDSQQKAQQLMQALMPFAEKMLTESGGFLPYAGVITPDEQIHLMQFANEAEDADSQEVFDYANQALREGAQQGKWTTTALVTDVNVTKPGEQESVQAVSFALDDSDGNSVEVFFPYTVKEGAVDFGTAFAQQGANQIFSEAGNEGSASQDQDTGTE